MDWGAIAGAVTGIVDRVSGGSNKNWRDRVDSMKLQQWQAQNLPALRAEGYRRAGLHPTLLAGSNFTPSVVSNVAGQSSAPPIDFSFLNKSSKLQNDLIQAQIDNVKADTQAKLNSIPGQNDAVAPIQTDQPGQMVNPLLQDVSQPRMHTPAPDKGVTITTPAGKVIPVSPGVREFINDLENKYGLEEAKEIVGGYYFLKDATVETLRQRELKYLKRARLTRKKRRVNREPGNYGTNFKLQRRSRSGGR